MNLPAPNYTQSPNVFFDEVFKTLSEGELRIVLVLIRQTFGWHKTQDRISLGQLSKKTGMTRGSVCRSLNSLLKKKLIQKNKVGEAGNEMCYYSFVMEEQKKEPVSADDGIETEEEKAIVSNNLDQSPKETPPVSVRDRPPSLLKRPTKETASTKETAAKEKKPAAAFSESAKEKESKVYPCLEPIDIPLHDKIEITRDYSIDKVVQGIEWGLSQKSFTKGLAAAIKYSCKHDIKYEAPKAKETPYEIIRKHFKHGNIYNGAEFYLSEQSVSFSRGMKFQDILLDKYFSWDKFKKMCESFGVDFKL